MGLYPVLRRFIPDVVESLVRKVLGDDKALAAVDPAGRAAYSDRVPRQIADPDCPADGASGAAGPARSGALAAETLSA